MADNEKAASTIKGNWFGRHKILTVILAVIVIAVIASASNGGSSSTSKNTASTSATKNTAAAKPAQDTKAATVAKIGQPARDGKFEFTVNSFKCGDTTITQPDNSYATTNAQGQFCQMDLTVKNIGTVQQNFDGGDQYVYDTSNKQYSYSSTGTIYANNSSSDFAMYQDINPGVSVQGVLVFDVPAGTTPTTAKLHDSSASNGVTVSLQ